jgi:hypothetical protein
MLDSANHRRSARTGQVTILDQSDRGEREECQSRSVTRPGFSDF